MTKEEAKRFGLQLLHGIMERNESYPVYANNVKQAIDALSEPSGSSEIPKDLEEAALSRMRDSDMYLSDAVIDEFGDELLKMALFGAKWQKEQMLKEAIPAIARPLDKEIWCDLDRFPELEDGEDIQIIIIKKEDK